MALLSLLPLLGLAYWLQDRLRIAPATSLLFAVSGWIIVAFAGGLVGALWWTCLLIWVLGVVLLGRQAFAIYRGRAPIAVPVPYGMLVILSVAFWLIHGDSSFFYYDEYAHWGIFFRDMSALDAFWGAETNSMHPRYPPAAPLWQYAFGIFSRPSDGVAYFGQFVLLFTPLMVLWHRLGWRQVGWILGVAVLCMVALLNFGHGVASLYVDHVIGTWFIGTILCVVADPPATLKRTLFFLAPLMVLSLIKDVGFAFAVAAAGIVAMLGLSRRIADGNRLAPALGMAMLLTIVLVAPAVVSVQTWKWNRDAHDVPHDRQSLSGVTTGLVGGESTLSDQQRVQVTQRFREVFFNQQISKDAVSAQFNAFSYPLMSLFDDRFRLTTFWLLVTFLFWYGVQLRLMAAGEPRWVWGMLGAGLMGTALAYSAALYFSYQFAFGDRGPLLSSYVRYIHSMALPLVIAAFAPLLPGLGPPAADRRRHDNSKAVSLPTGMFALGLAALVVAETPYARPLYTPNPEIAVRLQTEAAAASIRAYAGNEPVWVFLPVDNPNGFGGRVLRFQLSPTPAFIETSDAFLAESDRELLENWRGYRVLWFPMVSDELVTRLSQLLGEDFRGELIRVAEDERGSVRLEPMPSP
ncbi:MAG: hypothetical protein WBN65_08235 [Gammaproteobacteria bacterium]